jgi:hypothetical protein
MLACFFFSFESDENLYYVYFFEMPTSVYLMRKFILDFFSSEAIYSIHLFISIFNSFPKLFEKMVCDRITPVVRPVISDAQHGFVKGRSTVSNLVQFTKGVIGEIEDGWQVDGVYTDFSKVFDRVLHDLLKFNLSILFGESLLCWM